jgi:hypothetical protein
MAKTMLENSLALLLNAIELACLLAPQFGAVALNKSKTSRVFTVRYN